MPTRPASSCLRAALVGFLLGVPSARAVETPFTPYKDGCVTLSTWVGNSRTLQVRADESRAWVSHALPDGQERLPAGARLSVYVKDITRDGRIKVYLTTTLRSLEQQTRNLEYAAKDSVGSTELRAQDHLESMVDIPLSEVFLNSLRDGTYTGLILEGADGLDAEVGALEGSHGAILYLDYSARTDSVLVKSVAQELVRTHLADIKGRDGTNGLSGRDGVDGKDGKPGDSTVVFRLLQDRNFRAFHAFDRFRNSSAGRITPDSSGNGNDLTLSINGTNLRANAPGDSVVEFLGNGYAVASNSLSLNPYREIMISAKVKLSTDAPPDTQVLLSKGNQYELAVIGSRLMCRFKTVFGNWDWISGGAVPKGTWVTVGAGYDGQAVRTFVDGSQTSHLRFPNGPLAMETGSLYIGAANASGDWGFKGIMDQVKITSYTVNVQDSLAVMPGRATMTQVVADSVAGLKGLLDAKANLSGARFIGKVETSDTLMLGGDAYKHFFWSHPTAGNNLVLEANGDTEYRQKKGTNNGSGNITFLTGMGTGIGGTGVSTEKMRIGANGNVGIGTAAPIRKLHVNGEISVSRSDRTAYINVSDEVGNGGGNIVLRGLDDTGKTGVDANILLQGNVGVGKYPEAKLDVNGEVRAIGFFVINTGYKSTPLQCVDECAKKGGRMATVPEMYAFASGKNQACSYLWVLDDLNIGMVASGYPMYRNLTGDGCGPINTGEVPRVVGLTRNQSWSSKTGYDCGCYGIK